jgi:hypothetical protein
VGDCGPAISVLMINFADKAIIGLADVPIMTELTDDQL